MTNKKEKDAKNKNDFAAVVYSKPGKLTKEEERRLKAKFGQ